MGRGIVRFSRDGLTSVISLVTALARRSWDNRDAAGTDSLTRVVCEAEGIKIW
jgi:hypothetical protein